MNSKALSALAAKTTPIAVYVIGYIRVSTEEQLDSNSFEQQAKEIELWCKRRGVKLLAIFFDAISGGKIDERYGLNEAVEYCKTQDVVAGVCFFHFNRFFREVEFSERVRKDLSFYNKMIWSTQQDIDLNNHFGVFNFQVQQAVAELQRKETVQLLYNRRMAKAEAGGWIGSRVPYGFKAQQGELVELPDDKRNIRLIGRLRKWVVTNVTYKPWADTAYTAHPMTYTQIAEYMNLKMQFYCPLDRDDYDKSLGIPLRPDYGPKHIQPTQKKRKRPYVRNRSHCWTHNTIRGILVFHAGVPATHTRTRRYDRATEAGLTPADIGLAASARTSKSICAG